jgi:hypothetical protein
MTIDYNALSKAVCDMEDIKNTTKREGLWDCPKDNDGTFISLGDCVEDVLSYLTEMEKSYLADREESE